MGTEVSSGVQERNIGRRSEWSWSSLQTLLTDFDCRNDQHLKSVHNSPPFLTLLFHGEAKRYFMGLSAAIVCPVFIGMLYRIQIINGNLCQSVFIRPLDIHVGGLIFYHGFFLSSFFRRLISELTEQNSTISGHMVGSKCNLKTHVQYLGYPLPLKIGIQNHLFRPTSQVNGNFNGLFGVKQDIHKRASALQTTRGLLHRTKTTWTLVHKRLQTGSEFSPTLRKFCIPLHCQASQTEISKRNSTTLCQTVNSRPL